jgi:hypothetical protein
MSKTPHSQSIIRAYYVATVLFLLLDLVLNINVRIAFLEPYPTMRACYYAVIFGCMALILWKPAWTITISAFESLVTLIALIMSMGIRSMLITDAMLEGNAAFISGPEIINFVITGSIAYLAFQRGMKELGGNSRF